jgi:L-glyceraldehyde 3-phosphate reductase
MGVDYVDIFYHHRPDETVPLEETCYALSQIVTSGKALYIAISNYKKVQTEKIIKIMNELRCPVILNQVRYSILDRWIETDGLKNFAYENGVGLIIFSPLAQGLLTEKYLHGIPKDSRMNLDYFLKKSNLTPQLLNKLEKLDILAKNRGQTLAEMSLSWVLCHKEITSLIIGASKPEQIIENLKTNTNFSTDELEEKTE